ARFIPGTVLLIGFAVMMIATAIAMLRGRQAVESTGGHQRLPMPKIVAEGLVVGLVAVATVQRNGRAPAARAARSPSAPSPPPPM
ncbi:MAG TPA: hypothetical protein PKB10_15035, partial [Tepidisphaeraceae bacterium]|nr:hypothetical protein [Tepidisphaeraceae bacterium]